MKKLSKLYNYIRCIPKTLFFNFYYLPTRQALKFPIIVSHRTKFLGLGGKITIPENAKTAKIKLGFGIVQISDYKYSRFIWDLEKDGHIYFGNNIKIGTGCKLFVSGTLILGNRLHISGESSITCKNKIKFGNNCLVSWKTIFMDTDFHEIIEKGVRINPDKEISIGNSVWICANSTVLKGVLIGNNSIVSASSNVISSFSENNIIGGNPAKVIGSMLDKHFII